MRLLFPALAAAVLLTTPKPMPAAASSCVNPTTVRIQFGRGQRCWRYVGSATHFVGSFRAGQKIVVSSTGDATFADERGIWRRTQQREVDATLRVGNREQFIDIPETQGEEGEFQAPRTGTYTFGFSPCSMWNAPGTFIVCAH